MEIIISTSQGGYEDYYLLSLLLTLYSFFSLLPVGLDPIYKLRLIQSTFPEGLASLWGDRAQ